MPRRVAVLRDEIRPVQEGPDRFRDLADPPHLVRRNEIGVDPRRAGNSVDERRDLERPRRVLFVRRYGRALQAERPDGPLELLDPFLFGEVALREHPTVDQGPHEALGHPAVREFRHVAAVLLHLLQDSDQARAGRPGSRHLRRERAVVPEPIEKELRHFLLVLQVRLLLPFDDLEERRLGDVEESAVDQLRHVAEEERQEQGADVRAVDVGVGHDRHGVIADLGDVEVLPDPGPQDRDQRPDLGEPEDLVQPRLLDVQDLSAQRQDRLRAPVTPLLGRTAGAVSFDDEELRERGVLFLAVRELAGQRAGIERALPPHELARLARRFPRPRGLHDLVDDAAGHAGVFLEVRAELFVDHLLDPRLDLGGNELVLRLRGELRIADLHRHDGGQAFPAVVARETGLLQRLRQRVLLGVALQRARQRGLESLEVSSAVPVVDGVGEREDRLGVSLVPLERDLDPLLLRVALRVAGAFPDVLEVDDLVVDRLLGLVQQLDEGPDAPLVGEVVLLVGSLVVDRDCDPGVQER